MLFVNVEEEKLGASKSGRAVATKNIFDIEKKRERERGGCRSDMYIYIHWIGEREREEEEVIY